MVLALAGVVVMGTAGAAFFALVAKRASVGGPGITAPPPATIVEAAMVGDANGDQVDDVVVGAQVQENNESRRILLALDGNTGAILWQTKSFAGSSDSGIKAVVGNRALRANTTQLTAYDLLTGLKSWEVQLPERVAQFCIDDQPGALVLTKDKEVRRVDLATGKLATEGKVLPRHVSPEKSPDLIPCHPASSPSFPSRGVGVGVTSVISPQIDGMGVDHVLEQRKQQLLVAVGYKSPGSRVPTLAGVDRQGKTLWKSEVPKSSPLAAAEGAPMAVTLARGRVIVAFQNVQDKTLRLAAFSLKDGQRHFEVTVQTPDPDWANLVATDRLIVLRNRWRLKAFQLTDGKPLWTYGK